MRRSAERCVTANDAEQLRCGEADLRRISRRASANCGRLPAPAFYYWPKDSKTSTMYEWNFNVQRELPVATWFSTVAYVGGKGTYVDVVGLNINQAIPGPGAGCRPAAISEPQRCHRRRAVGQLDLQLAADNVRPAHGSGPIHRRLDMGAQHRQHQRRIEQQSDSELAQPGGPAGQLNLRHPSQARR